MLDLKRPSPIPAVEGWVKLIIFTALMVAAGIMTKGEVIR